MNVYKYVVKLDQNAYTFNSCLVYVKVRRAGLAYDDLRCVTFV